MSRFSLTFILVLTVLSAACGGGDPAAGGGAPPGYSCAADDPAITIVAQLEADELRAAIGELTEEQQQVVLLRFVAGQSPGEVAQALEKTENAVKQMQFRALRSLGRLLGTRG